MHTQTAYSICDVKHCREHRKLLLLGKHLITDVVWKLAVFLVKAAYRVGAQTSLLASGGRIYEEMENASVHLFIFVLLDNKFTRNRMASNFFSNQDISGTTCFFEQLIETIKCSDKKIIKCNCTKCTYKM